MSRRGQSTSLSGRSDPSGGKGTRNGGFVSTTTIFIVGIFLTSTVVLFGMHYFVEISAYLEQSPKFTKLTSSVEFIQQSIFRYNSTMSSALRGSGSTNQDASGATDNDPELTYAYEPIDLQLKQTEANEEEGDHYGDDAEDAEETQGKQKKPQQHVVVDREAEEAYGEEADDVAPLEAPVKKIDNKAKPNDKPTVVHKKPHHHAHNTANSISSEQALINNRLAGLKVQPITTTSNGKTKKPVDPYNYMVNIDPDWGMEGKWELPYIKVLPTKKPPLKKDRVVVFNDIHIPESGFNTSIVYTPSSVPGQPRALLEANVILQKHILYQNKYFDKHTHDLEDVMYYLKNSPECVNSPVYLTMATVHDDLYWQLIENFVYTLVKFEVVQCSLVICVSDLKCMKMCDDAYFPCYNYVARENPKPSVMEQIAQVKLLHIPQALTRGVDVFMLDLDVGFLASPQYMVKVFQETPIVDIFIQEDYLFIMNRTKEGWGQYFTEPLPNIGLLLVRGNNRTARVFELAWLQYLTMKDPYEKSQPGKDQNHVLNAMRIGRGTFGLKYAYFSSTTTPLLDKLVYKEGNTIELGGEVVQGYSNHHHSIAMHTTCYEKSTKVMGLKATNAFWNPRYYDSQHRTLTKQLLYIDSDQLLDEVRSLVWLALQTKRSVIVPNILGSEHLKLFDSYKNNTLWPGFRVTFLKNTKGKNDLNIQLLEPAFYWRIKRDYDAVPTPRIVTFKKDEILLTVRDRIMKLNDAPRIVISQEYTLNKETEEKSLLSWADDSVGTYTKPYSALVRTYNYLPSVKTVRNVRNLEYVNEVMQNMRTCNNIFGQRQGSRTCFQVCD